MVSPAMLIVALVIAIAIILFCIIVLKLNASIGMVLALPTSSPTSWFPLSLKSAPSGA